MPRNDTEAPANGLQARDDIVLPGTTIGAHIVVDAWVAESSALTSCEHMATLLQGLADRCGASVMQMHTQRFEPTGGLTAVAILSASHAAVHTWPEHSYLTVDLFVCDPSVIDSEAVMGVIARSVDALTVSSRVVSRPDLQTLLS